MTSCRHWCQELCTHSVGAQTLCTFSEAQHSDDPSLPCTAKAAAGVLIFRNTRATLQLLAAWRLYLSSPGQGDATAGEG